MLLKSEREGKREPLKLERESIGIRKRASRREMAFFVCIDNIHPNTHVRDLKDTFHQVGVSNSERCLHLKRE
jgi:hypothetical protein